MRPGCTSDMWVLGATRRQVKVKTRELGAPSQPGVETNHDDEETTSAEIVAYIPCPVCRALLSLDTTSRVLPRRIVCNACGVELER